MAVGTNTGQWVIKSKTEQQVKGPFTTEALSKMIINGMFTGQEDVCAYPDGDWKPLAKQPEFYEALMESLENPVVADNKRTQKMEAETVVRAPPKSVVPADEKPIETAEEQLKKLFEGQLVLSDSPEESDGKDKNLDDKKKNKSLPNRTGTGASSPNKAISKNNQTNQLMNQRNKNLEIQMRDIDKLKKTQIKKIFPIVVLIIAIFFLAAYYYLEPTAERKSGWRLISIRSKIENSLTEAEVKTAKRKMVKAFQDGSYEDIMKSQRDLVNAIESSPKDLEAIGILCMAYEQLWPFTKQTQEDLKAISIATQQARGVNAISNYSDICQTLYLLTKGQNNEARSLLEKSLDNQVDEKFSLGALLYLLKAEILENERNYLHSSAYYEQAAKLWPTWITAKFGLARAYYKLEKYNEARDQYEVIRNLKKNSKAALYGLGLIELKTTHSVEKAESFFSTGFEITEKIPKDFETEVLIQYAQILIDKNDRHKALEAVNQAYKNNPSHRALKEMLVSLGGEEKPENAIAEMILVGDQFARVGDHLVAQAQYKSAFELNPKSAIAAFKAAKSLWMINNSRDAVFWLEKSIQANPKFLSAYILKADYESRLYNFTEASRTLMMAQKKLSLNHDIVKAQALLEFRKNNMRGAILYGERAVKTYNADVELLSLLAQAHISFYMNHPNTNENIQKEKEESRKLAENYAGRVIELEPAWPEGQITFAKVISGTHGAVRAEAYLKDRIKEFPYTSEYRVALAEFYKENEKFYEAEAIYKEVVILEPKNKRALFGLADTYRILNKANLAQEYYDKTSDLDPGDVEATVAKAKLLLETASGKEFKAKIETALANLMLAKKKNPNFPKLSFLIAKAHLESGQYDLAIENAKEEKTKNPNLADPYILTAEVFYRKGQYQECAAEFSAAVKLRPNSAELYVKSASCYRLSGSVEIAEDMLMIASQKESGYPDIYRELGFVYEKKNNRPSAVLSFEKYLLLSPNAPDRQLVETKIRQLGNK